MREAEDLAAYEGLVGRTAQLFSARVGIERDDLKQELWIKVIAAKRTFDPARSKMSESAYVFSCLTNLIKDMKKYRARRVGLRIEHIEDHRDEWSGLSRFEFEYASVGEEEAYALLATFTLPNTLTGDEQAVVVWLVAGLDQSAIAERIGLTKIQVAASVKAIRSKLADWRPTDAPAPVPVAPVPVAQPIAA